LKQWIETMGLGVSVYSRVSAIPATRPYITIMDRQPLAPRGLEDGGPGEGIETCMIDVWQDWKSVSGSGPTVEDQTLVAKLEHNLQGGRPVDATGHPILVGAVPGGQGIVYRVRVVGSQQVSDPSVENLVHNAITVAVWRQL
jgi:hypothetical protein